MENNIIKNITITKVFFSIDKCKYWWKLKTVINEDCVRVYKYDKGDFRKPVYKETFDKAEDSVFYKLLNKALTENGENELCIDDCGG